MGITYNKDAFTGKIQCTQCEKWFGVRRDIYEKRIKKFGSEEELLANYTCRACQKELGVDSSGAEKQIKSGSNEGGEHYIAQKWMKKDPYDGVVKPTWRHNAFIERCHVVLSGPKHTHPCDPGEFIDVCMFPDFFLSHERSCIQGKEKCKWYDKCGLRLRGGPPSSRYDCIYECSSCGQWVTELAEICPKCGERFE